MANETMTFLYSLNGICVMLKSNKKFGYTCACHENDLLLVKSADEQRIYMLCVVVVVCVGDMSNI